MDRDGKVLAGHGRLLRLPRTGHYRSADAVPRSPVTQAQASAFTIADNRLTEIASWDEQLLAEQLKEL